MTRKLTKAVLSLAVTAAIGAAAIGVNGFFVANALAAPNDRETPVITSEAAPMNTNAGSTATVVADGNGNQAIVSEQDKLQLQRDLDAKRSTAESSNSTFVAGTPSEKDLTEKKAIELAKKSVDGEYALTDDTWSKFSTGAVLNVVDPKVPVWSVTFYPTNQNDFSQIGTYNVTIDSFSGKIIKIMSAADGVG